MERDHGAGRAERRRRAGLGGAVELNRDRVAGRILHLRGDGALEDQLVDSELVARDLAGDLFRGAEDVPRRADRLVRLLRVRHRALVPAGRVGNGLCAVCPLGVCPCGTHGCSDSATESVRMYVM